MKSSMLVKSILAIGLLAAMPAAEARGFGGGYRGGFRGGFRSGVVIGPAFGPAYGPWGYWGPYSYPGYGYYGYPGYYGGFSVPLNSHRNQGQVKIDTKQKDAQVYINGAYAGIAKDMKSTWLKEGTYDLELRAPDGQNYTTQIYIAPGKTVHVRPDLPADTRS